MASRSETLAFLQKAADDGREDELNDQYRSMFDAAVREGLIKARRGALGAAQEIVSPRFQEDLPEVEFSVGMPTDPAKAQAFIDELSLPSPVNLPQFEKYRGARIVEGRYGRPVVETREGERRYLNKPGFNLADIPRAVRGTREFIEEAAPYMHGGGPALGLARGVIGQGITGLSVEAGKAGERFMRGEEQRPVSLLTTPAIAMAGEVLGRGIFALGGKIYRGVTGRRDGQNIFDESGQISPDAARAMRENASSQDIDNAAFAALMDEAESGALTPEQLARLDSEMESFIVSGQATDAQVQRYNLFKRFGMEPTRAQVTRTADDFMAQQEAAKTSGPVRGALEQQQVQLGRAFEEAGEATGGRVTAETAPVQQAVIDKATRLDDEVTSIYKQAQEALPNERSVDISDYVNAVLKNKKFDTASAGTYTALVGTLDDLGVKIPKGANKIDEPFLVTPRDAEMIRQSANDLYAPMAALDRSAKIGNRIVGEVKEVLDLSVGRTLGKDFFVAARNAYKEFRRGLDPDQLSKFSKNTKSLIRDLLEQRIAPANVFNQVVSGRGYTAADLRALKNYIVGRGKNISQQGASAWANLRAETMDYIKNQAFGGPLNQSGVQTLTRARLESAINRIGRDKLKVIFNETEMKFLDDIMTLAKTIEPVSGTFQGRGPSAQAVAQLEKTAKAAGSSLGRGIMDFAETIFKSAREAGAEREVLSGAAPILTEARRQATRIRPEIPAAGGRIGAVGLEQSLGDE